MCMFYHINLKEQAHKSLRRKTGLLFYRNTDWLRLEGASECQLLWPPCSTCCPGPCPDGFWISPKWKNHLLFWTTSAGTWSPKESASWWSWEIFSVPFWGLTNAEWRERLTSIIHNMSWHILIDHFEHIKYF